MQIGSLASRYFRINASINGYFNDNRLLIGYGLGNSLIPLRSGYNEAIKDYTNKYVKEVNELKDKDFSDDSVSYCLYTRITSEFGLINLIIIIIYLYKTSRKIENHYLRKYVYILLYIYIQFESYAFYTIWLYIVLMNLQIGQKDGNILKEEYINDE